MKQMPLTSKDKFSMRVEEVRFGADSYLEAMETVCKEQDIEFQSVGRFINDSLRLKLEAEARDRNLLKRERSNKKPIFNDA